MEEQKWRIYAPEGRDTNGDCKMNLRTMSNNAHLIGTGELFVIPITREDYGDDTYLINMEEERVRVVAREAGQHYKEKGVFDNLERGIFFHVSDKNFKKAEKKILEAFF
jgi:hypothetical protein